MKSGSKNGAVSTGLIITLVVLIVGFSLVMTLMSWQNVEVKQRNLIVAKQKDNTSEFDSMKKKIASVASIPEAQFDSLKELFTSHAEARTAGGSRDGSLMKWVQESIPNVDKSTEIYTQVMNIVVGSRDAWTQRQKEILDMSRVHNDILDVGFRGLFLTQILNRERIDVVIVTSANTKKVFELGEDNDDGVLFNRNVEKP